MKNPLHRMKGLVLAIACAGAAGAQAQSLQVELEIPRLQVAEYHRPYIAIWIAREDNSVAKNLAVLYDVDMANDEGEKWLKDMRQWWRRGGRKLDMPVDGVSAATRGPGTHALDFSDKVGGLASGSYRLMVEAAREVGGREVLEIPFSWPPEAAESPGVTGETEVGAVTLNLKP